MDFIKEITTEYTCEPVPIMEAITSAVKQLQLQKRGGKVSNKSINSFLKSNPSLTAAAAINALSAYQQYKTNKRNTISLFAKSPYEKRMIKTIVDSMTKTGKFKLHRTRYADGGRYYEMRQVRIGFK